MELRQLLVDCARSEFPLAGVVDIGPAIGPHVEAYDRWLSEGKAGAMEYLVRGRDRRADPRLVFPDAESVLCVAIPYRRRPLGSQDPSVGPRYARYIEGDDYHIVVAEKLERVMKRFEEETRAQLEKPLSWKVCVDTSAVLERSWAALAGLGWIGKNSMLIHPKLGSYLYLGEVLLNVALGAAPAPLPNYCGNCERCLNVCPTNALERPGWLDSKKCISYWTLEKRGELDLKSEQKQAIGSWVAGCDLCQEVCPFNFKPSRAAEAETEGKEEVPAGWPLTWLEHLNESPDSYKARVSRSALKRVKPQQFSRNLAIATLNAWERADEAARAWMTAELAARIRERYETETDPVAKAEWKICYERISASAASE